MTSTSFVFPREHRGSCTAASSGSRCPEKNSTTAMCGPRVRQPQPHEVKWKDKGSRHVALSTRIMSKPGLRDRSVASRSNTRRSSIGSPSPSSKNPTSSAKLAASSRASSAEVAKELSRQSRPGRPTSTPCACGWSRTRRITMCSSRRTCSATSSATWPRGWLGGWASRARRTSATSSRCSSRRTARRRSTSGQNVVNPMAMLLTVKLMFDWLEEEELADRLEAAIARVISDGTVATYDVKGRARANRPPRSRKRWPRHL